MSSNPSSPPPSLPSSPVNSSISAPDLISPITSDQEHESSEDDGIHSDWSPSSPSLDAVEGRRDVEEELDYDMLASQDWSEISSGLSNRNSQSTSGDSNGTGRSISEGEEGRNSEGDVSIISGLESQSTDSTSGKTDDEEEKDEGGMRLSFPDPLDASDLENHTLTSTPKLETRIKRRSTITMSTQTDRNDEVETEYSFLHESTTNEDNQDSVATLPLISTVSRTSTPSPFYSATLDKYSAVESSTFISARPATTSTTVNRKTRKLSLVTSSPSSSLTNGRDSKDISKWVESSGSYSEALKKSGELSKVKEKEKEEIQVVVKKAEFLEKNEEIVDKDHLNEDVPIEEETKGLTHLLKTLIGETILEWLVMLGPSILILSVFMICRVFPQDTTPKTSRHIVQKVTSTSTIVRFTTATVTSTSTSTIYNSISTPLVGNAQATTIPIACLQNDPEACVIKLLESQPNLLQAYLAKISASASDSVSKSIKKKEQEFKEEKIRRKKEVQDQKIAKKLEVEKEKLKSRNSTSSDYLIYQDQFLENFPGIVFNFSSLTSLFDNFSLDAQLELIHSLSTTNHSKVIMDKITRKLRRAASSARITRARKVARSLSKLLEKKFSSKVVGFQSFLNPSSSSSLQDSEFVNKVKETARVIVEYARDSTRQATKKFTENPKSPFKRFQQIEYYLGGAASSLRRECFGRISQFTAMVDVYEKELTQEALLHRVKVASKVFQKLKKCDMERRQKVFKELKDLIKFARKWRSVAACIDKSNDPIARKKCDVLAASFST